MHMYYIKDSLYLQQLFRSNAFRYYSGTNAEDGFSKEPKGVRYPTYSDFQQLGA